eukprot:scaffold20.g7782.t1
MAAAARQASTAFLKAGLVAGTPQEEELGDGANSFLLVPDAAPPGEGTPRRRLDEPLPVVWQDLFACVTRAASTEYLHKLAAEAPPPHLVASTPAAGTEGPAADSAADAPELGLAHDTAFRRFLCPEALVQRHRLGAPQVRRLYRSMQAFSLGFHQATVELTAHAAHRGALLAAVWRAYAMLWDSALQVVFAADTVQLSRERQAAVMTSEHLMGLLREADAATAAARAEAAAAVAAAEASAVEALAVRADAAAALQRMAQLEQEARELRHDRDGLAAQLEGQKRETASLHRQLNDTARLGTGRPGLSRPGSGPPPSGRPASGSVKAGRPEAVQAPAGEGDVRRLEGMVAAASKQVAAALSAKDAALQQLREEAQRREAAEQAVRQLRDQLAAANEELAAAQARAAGAGSAQARLGQLQEQATVMEAAQAELVGWKMRAEAAEAEDERLRQQVLEAQKKSEELVDALWPLTKRVKELEAQLA